MHNADCNKPNLIKECISIQRVKKAIDIEENNLSEEQKLELRQFLNK